MVAFLRRITENWKLKTLAFALAVLLWVVVSADQTTTGWFSVPLDVVVTDPNYRLDGGDIPSEVEVRFAGPGRDLFDLALRRPTLRLTVNDVEDEVEARALDPRMVQISGRTGVDALDVRPAVVRLQFTRIESRIVPVRPRISAQLGEEWAIVDTLVTEPPTVRITGPQRAVATVHEVATVPFTITPNDTIVDVVVPLDTTTVPGLDLSTGTVRVSGRIDRVVQRTIEGVPVDVGPGISILPTEVDVTLRGPRRVVGMVSPGYFRVVVSIDEIPARIPGGGVPVPLRVDGLGPGVSVTLDPAEVRLFPTGAGPDTVAPPSSEPGRGIQIDTVPR